MTIKKTIFLPLFAAFVALAEFAQAANRPPQLEELYNEQACSSYKRRLDALKNQHRWANKFSMSIGGVMAGIASPLLCLGAMAGKGFGRLSPEKEGLLLKISAYSSLIGWGILFAHAYCKVRNKSALGIKPRGFDIYAAYTQAEA